jgi:hypothetical protein
LLWFLYRGCSPKRLIYWRLCLQLVVLLRGDWTLRAVFINGFTGWWHYCEVTETKRWAQLEEVGREHAFEGQILSPTPPSLSLFTWGEQLCFTMSFHCLVPASSQVHSNRASRLLMKSLEIVSQNKLFLLYVASLMYLSEPWKVN